jgi:hypothetical protein
MLWLMFVASSVTLDFASLMHEAKESVAVGDVGRAVRLYSHAVETSPEE